MMIKTLAIFLYLQCIFQYFRAPGFSATPGFLDLKLTVIVIEIISHKHVISRNIAVWSCQSIMSAYNQSQFAGEHIQISQYIYLYKYPINEKRVIMEILEMLRTHLWIGVVWNWEMKGERLICPKKWNTLSIWMVMHAPWIFITLWKPMRCYTVLPLGPQIKIHWQYTESRWERNWIVWSNISV